MLRRIKARRRTAFETLESRMMLSGDGLDETLYSDNNAWIGDFGLLNIGSQEEALAPGSNWEVSLLAEPAVPHNVVATVVSPSEIYLTWDLGDEADTGIVIERKAGHEGSYQTLTVLPGGENAYTDTSCWAGTTYTYRIKSTNEFGDSGYREAQSATTLAVSSGALTTITDLQAIANSPNTATISFTDPNPADEKRSYLLERSDDGVLYRVVKWLGTTSSWTDVGLTPNASYFYRVRGTSWNHPTSDYSNAAQLTLPMRLEGAPIEPSDLQSVMVTATSATLTWTNHDDSNPVFRIERSVFDPWHPKPWIEVGITEPDATSYTDAGLNPETSYVYRVSARNELADSGYAVPTCEVMVSLFGDGIAVITASAGTGASKVYNIGPGQTYEKIADLNWSSLGPGDTVNIHYKPGGYRELFMISTRGTAQDWITINGIPDPTTGALPIIDGLEAVLAPQFRSSYVPLHGASAIMVGTRPGYANGYRPGYVTIQNLQIQRCYAGNVPNTFTDYDGTTKTYRSGSGIFLFRADHITISNCIITDNGQGIFGAGESGFDRLMTDITVSSNHIYNNGIIASDRYHNTYIEAIDTVYEFNRYGPTRLGAKGNGLKDRSVGVVVRGNYLEGGARELQLPSAENQDTLAVTIPRYHRAMVYGNTIVEGPERLSGPVKYGGENHHAYDRRGVLYMYHNTLVVRSDKSNAWRVSAVSLSSTSETLDARNNIFTAIPATPGAERTDFGLLGVNSWTELKANAYFGRNWVPPDYLLHGYTHVPFQGHAAGLENLLVGETRDPGFLGLWTEDYRLASDSEVLDLAGRLAGATLAFPIDQQYGASHRSTDRPVVGSAMDLGAFEYGTYPPLVSPGDQQHTAGQEVQLWIVAYGADSFSASGLPPGLVIDDTGLVFGTIDLQAAGVYDVVITASESGASSMAQFTWIVDAMPIDITLSATTVIEKMPAAAVGIVMVTGLNQGEAYTWSVSDERFEIRAHQLKLKSGFSLDRDAESVVWLDITAMDSAGLSCTETFELTVVRPIIIDDGDPDYSEAGPGWYSISWWKSGYQVDSRFVYPGSGQSAATWQQSLVPGVYTIQASWSAYHNNVSDAPYRIYDGDTLLAEVRVDQKRNPTWALNDPVPFLTLATVEITSGTVRVVLGNDATGGTLVVADAVRIVPGTIAAPPVLVAGPGIVDDGEAGYSESEYGWYSISWWRSGYQSDSRIANAGDGRSTASWQQALDPGTYTVQASWTGYHNNVSNAPYRIYDGDVLVAEIRVDQKRTPTWVLGDPVPLLTLATVEIASGTIRVVLGNDATGGTLVVADAVRIVPGTIVAPPVLVAGPGIVDDGEAGYSESEYGWYSISWWRSGYQSDSRIANAGDGRSTATWQQTLDPGTYTVQASWTGYHNNVSNAPYRIYDGDVLVAEIRVNQKQTPTWAPGDPVALLTLATVEITSGTIRVVLGNDATGGTLVVADAVRIVPEAIASSQGVLLNVWTTGSSIDQDDSADLWSAGVLELDAVQDQTASVPSRRGSPPNHANAHKAVIHPKEGKNLQCFRQIRGIEDPEIDMWYFLADIPWII